MKRRKELEILTMVIQCIHARERLVCVRPPALHPAPDTQQCATEDSEQGGTDHEGNSLSTPQRHRPGLFQPVWCRVPAVVDREEGAGQCC